jgi:hypothetical protein
MAKNISLVFGDVVRDPSSEKLYVAISGATALKNNKQFILFLDISEEFNCLNTQPIPYSRKAVEKFIYIKNIQVSMHEYLRALEIKHNKELVKAYSFLIKKPVSAIVE